MGADSSIINASIRSVRKAIDEYNKTTDKEYLYTMYIKEAEANYAFYKKANNTSSILLDELKQVLNEYHLLSSN